MLIHTKITEAKTVCTAGQVVHELTLSNGTQSHDSYISISILRELARSMVSLILPQNPTSRDGAHLHK